MVGVEKEGVLSRRLNVGPATRYPSVEQFTTQLDPFQDLIQHLEFLTAVDSAAELLRNRCPGDAERDRPVALSHPHWGLPDHGADQDRHEGGVSSHPWMLIRVEHRLRRSVLFSEAGV